MDDEQDRRERIEQICRQAEIEIALKELIEEAQCQRTQSS